MLNFYAVDVEETCEKAGKDVDRVVECVKSVADPSPTPAKSAQEPDNDLEAIDEE